MAIVTILLTPATHNQEGGLIQKYISMSPNKHRCSDAPIYFHGFPNKMTSFLFGKPKIIKYASMDTRELQHQDSMLTIIKKVLWKMWGTAGIPAYHLNVNFSCMTKKKRVELKYWHTECVRVRGVGDLFTETRITIIFLIILLRANGSGIALSDYLPIRYEDYLYWNADFLILSMKMKFSNVLRSQNTDCVFFWKD